jgi:hypothetical protein
VVVHLDELDAAAAAAARVQLPAAMLLTRKMMTHTKYG